MAIANITNNILTDSGVSTSSLLPLTGGTLTGALNLTYATPYIYLNASTGSQGNLIFNVNSSEVGNINVNNSFFQITNFTTGGWLFKNSLGNNVFTIANNGQANLSSTLGLGGALSGTSATFSGNIGVGTASPSDRLNVVVSSNGNVARFDGPTSGLILQTNATTTDIISYGGTTPAYRALNFATSATTALSIATTGAATFSSSVNLGSIANSGDTSLLNIKQSSTAYNNGIYLERGGERNGYFMYIGGSVDSLTFRRNYFGTQSDVMSLTRDGNVGIGTSSPVQPLQLGLVSVIAQDANSMYIGANFGNGTGGSYIKSQFANQIHFDSALGFINFKVAGSGTAGNAISYTTAMAITSGGKVGIGTSSPSSTRLDVVAAAGGTALVLRMRSNDDYSFLQFTNNAATEVISEIYSNRTASNTGSLIFATNNGGSSTERMRITSAGVINTTSRLNVNGAGDNSLFSLINNGTTYTLGFSPNATASTSTTLTITTATTTWIYNGTGTATWTLPTPSGTNQMFWIRNAGTGTLTLNAFSGTNIVNTANSLVSSITIAVGATALIQQDGNIRSYQLQ